MNRDILQKDDTQLLKGIAIIMIIIQHLGQSVGGGISIVNPLGPIGVFIFLFCSGYGLTASYEKNGRKDYLKKRIIKVYLPYAAAVILFIISHSIYQPDRIIKYLLLIELPQGSYWYLILMFYWYAVFWLLTHILKRKKLLAVMLLAASFLIAAVKDFGALYVWQMLSFPSGVMLKSSERLCGVWDNIFKKPYFKLGIFLTALFCIIAKKSPYVEARELGVADVLLQLGMTVFIGLFILLNIELIKKFRIVSKAVSHIGNISYELYLGHVIMLDYLKENFSLSVFSFYLAMTAVYVGILFLITHKCMKRSV